MTELASSTPIHCNEPVLIACISRSLENDGPGWRKWVLVHENNSRSYSTGWIFREHPGREFGHSGYHDSIKKAVVHAIESSAETKVFQFVHESEMDDWLNRPF